MSEKITLISSALYKSIPENVRESEIRNSCVCIFAEDTNQASEFFREVYITQNPHICITEASTLEEIAPAVIECVETFGGIDTLIFSSWQEAGSDLFLDISHDEFAFYTGLLNKFHLLCKCALPYMLGRDDAAVIIPVEETIPQNIARAAYRGALLAMAQSMSEEFEPLGIKIKTCTFGL